MDELNLDDLFLGGDDHVVDGRMKGEMGGGGGGGGGLGGFMGDIFTDLEFDLGDIVEGVIGEDDGVWGNNQSKVSFSNYLEGARSNNVDDSGHGGNANDMLMGKIDFHDSDDADLLLEPQPFAMPSRRRSSLNIDSMVSSSSPPVARRGARTARMNPHLAVLQQQQEQQQNIKQELSSLMTGSGGGRGLGGKRRRRKSKKFGIDNDDDSNEEEETGVGEDAVAGDSGPITKKSRRAISASPRLLNRLHQQGEVGACNQSFCTPSSTAAAATRHHQQQQLQQQREENELQQQQRMTEIKRSIYDYGLPPSRLIFFPYMNLPNGMDVKKKGQRSYPILERFSNPQSGYGNDTGFAVAAIDATTRSNSTDNENSASDLNPTTTPFTTSETNVALITKTSPIYELFGQHIGVVDTNTTWTMTSDKSNDNVEGGGMGEQQQHQLPPSSNLIASLTKSTDQIHRILQQLQRHGKKKKKTLGTSKKTKKDNQECEQQEDQEQKQKQGGSIIHHSSSTSSPQQLIEDLANLYSSQVRQAAFLRQNLMNMESWCEDHLTKEEMGTAFPVGRRRVEKVLKLLWAHKVSSYSNRISIIQQNQEMERLGKRADAFTTDIVTTTNPIILIKVKVKMSGWRDKPSKLIARLLCPRRWRVASKRGAEFNAAATAGAPPPTPLLTAIPPLDLSFADRATLETAACEVLRFDLIPKKMTTIISTGGTDASPTTSSSLVTVNEVTVMETLTDSSSPISTSRPVSADSTKTVVFVKRGLNSVVSDQKEVVKKKTKKMRSKLNEESVSAAIVSSSLSTAASMTPGHPLSSASTVNAFANKKKVVATPLVSMPHVPGYHQIPKEDEDNEDIYRQERHRLVLALYGSILQPAITPTERRSILASEISLTMARLKKQHERKQKQIHASDNSKRYRMETIDREILDLQATYLDDLEIMPETCSTFGLWKYMAKSNYFDVLEKDEDVFIGLEGIFQPEVMAKEDELLDEREVGEYCWGRLPRTLPARILAKTATTYFLEEEGDGENSAKGNVTENGDFESAASSPIYERLQSLLVEEDDWSTSSDIVDRDGGVSDEDDDDDDNLLASLSSYSPEEFIHGPKKYDDIELKEENSSSTSDISFTKDKATLDLSALTLDQRTYIQLCAAGLVDRKLMPFSGFVSSSSSSSDESPPSFAKRITFDDDDDDAEPVDVILQKMMDKLSSLNAEMNARVAKVQRMALSHVNAVEAAATTLISTQPSLSSSTCQRNKDEENDDETLILSKYKRLEIHQRKEKQRQDVRTSGRVKMGSNKFDDDEWLPW